MAKLMDIFKIKNVIIILENGDVLYLTPSQVEKVKAVEIGKL